MAREPLNQLLNRLIARGVSPGFDKLRDEVSDMKIMVVEDEKRLSGLQRLGEYGFVDNEIVISKIPDKEGPENGELIQTLIHEMHHAKLDRKLVLAFETATERSRVFEKSFEGKTEKDYVREELGKEFEAEKIGWLLIKELAGKVKSVPSKYKGVNAEDETKDYRRSVEERYSKRFTKIFQKYAGNAKAKLPTDKPLVVPDTVETPPKPKTDPFKEGTRKQKVQPRLQDRRIRNPSVIKPWWNIFRNSNPNSAIEQTRRIRNQASQLAKESELRRRTMEAARRNEDFQRSNDRIRQQQIGRERDRHQQQIRQREIDRRRQQQNEGIRRREEAIRHMRIRPPHQKVPIWQKRHQPLRHGTSYRGGMFDNFFKITLPQQSNRMKLHMINNRGISSGFSGGTKPAYFYDRD